MYIQDVHELTLGTRGGWGGGGGGARRGMSPAQTQKADAMQHYSVSLDYFVHLLISFLCKEPEVCGQLG